MAGKQNIVLKIRVLDSQGNLRGGSVDIEFKHRTLSDRAVQRGLDASREIAISGLRRTPIGDYQVTVTPNDVFDPQSQFINLPASGFATMEFVFGKHAHGPHEHGPETHKVPDILDEPGLSKEIGVRITGSAADGSEMDQGLFSKVIWVDAGEEVLVHLDSTTVRILDRTVLVSVDLETDQTGRSAVVVAFALGNREDQAGLFAVTDELPHGNPLLVARWGLVLQNAIWVGLLGLAKDHAIERGQWPAGIFAERGSLLLAAGSAAILSSEQKR